MFSKRHQSNIHKYSNLKLVGWRKTEYCEIQNLLQKAVFVLQLLFCESNHFCNKTSFCNIIYKRILSTLHDVFEKMGVKIIHKHSFWDLWVNIGGIPWDWNFYYKKPLFDVNLKEYGEFENVLPSFFIAIFAHITMFLKRIWSILHKYSNLKLVGWRKTEYCEIESLLQKAVFVLQLLFCESNNFCNKTSFCNII